MNTEWNKLTRHLVGIGLVLFGLYLIYLSRSVLTLLVVAALIAFLLMPLVGFLQQRLKLPRVVAVLLTHFMLVILILLSPLLFLPPIISGFNELAGVEYELLFNEAVAWTTQTLIRVREIDYQLLGTPIDLSAIVDPALEVLQGDSTGPIVLPSIETLLNSLRTPLTVTVGFAANVAGSVFAGVFAFVLTFLFSIYISLDAQTFRTKFLNLAPPVYRPEFDILLGRLVRTWRAYLRGQLNLMLIIGIVTWIVGMAIGLPNAFTLAVIAGIMELLPGIGPFLAAIPAILIALIQGSNFLPVDHLTFALIVIGCYVLIQQLENNLIVPRVIGEAVELPPLVVLIGVLVGTSVAGLLGAILAAPVVASIREITGYLYAKIFSLPPFPPQPEISEPVQPTWIDPVKSLLVKGRGWLIRSSSPRESQNVEPTPPEN